MNKRYLGDSVYVEINKYGQIVLTTENGYGPSNTIYLEPEVFENLESYLAAYRQRKNQPAAQKIDGKDGRP